MRTRLLLVALVALVGLPADLAPEPEPFGGAGTADWLVPVVVGTAVLVVLAVAAVVVVLRRRGR